MVIGFDVNMAGRYPTGSVAQHPAYQQGVEADATNEKKHADHAADLRPRGLPAPEKRVWDRIAPELSKAGRLRPLFADFLREYCVVKVAIDEARAHLNREGWTYETTGRHGAQLKSRPEVAQYNDDWRKWNSLVGQLGLSPATELRFNDKQGDLFINEFDDV
jgi:P27 family predicted phage terminase small subunit